METKLTIPAVHKAVAVMQYVADRTSPVTVKELSYSLGIPLASCYRMVRTLLEHNWLREEPGSGLRIAFGLANLARSYSEIEHALKQVETPLRRLAATLSLSAKVTLWEGHYVTTALRVEPVRPNAITSPVGYRFHVAIGSAGAALLSVLSDEEVQRVLETAPQEVWSRQSKEDVWQRIKEFKQTGISKDMGQQHPSIFAISALLRLTETSVAALTLVGWPDEFSGDKPVSIISTLKQSVAEMHQMLGTQAAAT